MNCYHKNNEAPQVRHTYKTNNGAKRYGSIIETVLEGELCKEMRPRGIICLLLMLLAESRTSVPVCITNCVQCKQMFGPYFQGKACGDACVLSNGQLTPDCNNPRTLGGFLKRLY